MQQIICTIKIRRAPTRHDNIYRFPTTYNKTIRISASYLYSTADKAYDSEDNHVLVRDILYAFSIIPSRYEHVPIRRTHGRYRKKQIMKRGYYSQLLYRSTEQG